MEVNPLQKYRALKGWTLEKLAVEADVSSKTITMIENNKQRATARTLGKLAVALGVEYETLLPLLDTTPSERGSKGGQATAKKYQALLAS